ncbi:MAG: YlmC/YmxH family sporulation protein [Lachnospiraceae bacterium]|nr:YlmC/YmxH family sporulation protein [Lachnospiraceae bacterium]
MPFSELKCKSVINLKDGKCLGKIGDLEFDECSGQICKLIIPSSNKLCCFLGGEPEFVIPVKNIRKIGPDIIIVDI